ncbi:hypothetical protein [Paraburkholderia terrae]|uniref:hypothetical protein n=1 Tax=Paraburkholderia terrae TaxID=311230 RepID=UPI0020BF5F17|nr:hypothetical protein [Paraburkholderia terrae]
MKSTPMVLRLLITDDMNGKRSGGNPERLTSFLKLQLLSGPPGAILIVARGAFLTTTPDRFVQATHPSRSVLQKWG